MKNLLIIIAILFAISANGQETTNSLAKVTITPPTKMKAVKVETSVDGKFERISDLLQEMEKQVRHLMASETASGELTTEQVAKQTLTLEYIAALKTVQKAYRPKFMKAVESTIEVDSLDYRNQQDSDEKELTRLKAAINLGQDSTVLQPRANSLKNGINARKKIFLTWKVVK